MIGESYKIKLVFLFMRNGAATRGSYSDKWEPTRKCSENYMTSFQNEGYFQLLQKLLDNGIIGDLKIFYESNRNPGWADWVKHKNAKCMVIPELHLAKKYIEKDAIIWARGGFRAWHDLLLDYKGKNWLMLYAANTGRQRWPWWDIVLDDITMRLDIDSDERLWVPFIKPIDDEHFVPKDLPYKYDICVGASHIHDKKGQWRIQNVIEAMDGMKPKIIIPSSGRRGIRTTPFLDWAMEYGATMPGHVPRKELVNIFAQSKMAVFLGTHGQNDRGPLEALSCGCPVVIGSPDYHTSILSKMDSDYIRTIPGAGAVDRYHNVVEHIKYFLSKADEAESYKRKKRVAREFKKHLGFEKSYNNMAELFLLIQNFGPEFMFKESVLRILQHTKKGRQL